MARKQSPQDKASQLKQDSKKKMQEAKDRSKDPSRMTDDMDKDMDMEEDRPGRQQPPRATF
ncbi:hypothetical protein AB0953_08865 [Streptomyces sp. NPDC046866]|uniref:hypothetical protein n=1 Tax=Streptomyces sp. NPDC046866 TaxID=3154921 RepID=UPI003455DAE9